MAYEAFHELTSALRPVTPPRQVIRGEHWRISVITDSLIRLEWSSDGIFEDRPTQTVLNRDLGREVHASIVEADGGVTVNTPALRLEYDGRAFSREGLSIVVKGVPYSQFNTWHYGDESHGNLKGTTQTLDTADGAVELDDGILSRDGWAVLDDSSSNVLSDEASVRGEKNPFGIWPVARSSDGESPTRIDLYFFGHGLRFIEAIDDFYRLTGSTPLLPRWALGNWWSRFYRYTQQEYLDLMQRFNEQGIPFTVAVMDMDWHVTDVDPRFGSGWTGYTWNRELFPDHRAFLDQLHERNMRVTLNEHPRDGIRAFESEYAEMARDMGLDAASQEAIPFDPASPRFMDAYLAMHHRMEQDGVDFWWIDWQQGGVTKQRGLDPLWMLNYTHYLDSAREAHWPLTFSRYAGPGSHRYPIGFSGDTVTTWQSLEFQPNFTATASNIGYGWWSHDIGGHMLGYRDDELELRWYQYGVFSPISRLHSSSSPFSGKEPWNFPEPERSGMIAALRLRHELLPYLHSMNHRAAFGNRPLVEPMYWQSPNDDAAYRYPNEYRFGSELVVAAAVRPLDRAVMRTRVDLWLPHGDWFDLFDGRRYRASAHGGRRTTIWRGLDRIPVFARAGGIVPLQILQDGDCLNSTDNPNQLRILAFPGNGSFTLMEDNGDWSAAQSGKTACTRLHQQWNDASTDFVVSPANGDISCLPHTRDWTIVFRGVADTDPTMITATVDGVETAHHTSYDIDTLSLSVTVRNVPVTGSLSIHTDQPLQFGTDQTVEDCRRILLASQMSNPGKDFAFDMIRRHGTLALTGLTSMGTQGDGSSSAASSMPQSVISALTEVLLRT